jgi:predicted ester cyclase
MGKIETAYRNYISAINSQNWELVQSFLNNTITHNDRQLSKPQYCQLMTAVFDACPDISFGIDKLLVNEESAEVACRIQFVGTPVKTFLGCEIAGDGGEREVSFSEHVFYVFRDGKIADVKSLVDVDKVRRQLSA